jgi:hypothetical protein
MVRLASEVLSVEVLVERGCTIASIVESVSGLEVLWYSERPLPVDLGPTGEASRAYFDNEVFAGGWFPMFPTAGGPGGRDDLRLHGEAPRIPWTTRRQSTNELVTELCLTQSGLLLERAISVVGRSVLTRTTVTNMGLEQTDVSAGEHPCFNAKHLQLDELILGVEVVQLSQSGVRHRVFPATGLAVLRSISGAAVITIEWDPGLLPGLLVWEDSRGIVAVEPKSFIGRSADEVGHHWWRMKPGEVRRWSMTVSLA